MNLFFRLKLGAEPRTAGLHALHCHSGHKGKGEDLHDILVHLVLDADHSDDMYNYIYIYAAMPIY